MRNRQFTVIIGILSDRSWYPTHVVALFVSQHVLATVGARRSRRLAQIR